MKFLDENVLEILSYMHGVGVDLMVSWFFNHRRMLPWRNHRTPYSVLVSEMMLQQTRVEVVIPYFYRWMQQFPTLLDLSLASEEEVVKAWEGLGYYRRARSLLRIAQLVQERFYGEIPSDFALLRSLPGIGEYTASAILAFAYSLPKISVDGNVLRVASRLFGVTSSIDCASTRKEITLLLQSVTTNGVGHLFAEALIELGACVCRPKALCHVCPLEAICVAKCKNAQEIIPIKSPKPSVITIHRWVGVVLSQHGVFVLKNKDEGLMGGLCEFPFIEANHIKKNGYEYVQTQFEKEWGVGLHFVTALLKQEHSFTRYKAVLFPYVFSVQDQSALMNKFSWVSLERLNQMAFSAGHRRIASSLLAFCDKNCIV